MTAFEVAEAQIVALFMESITYGMYLVTLVICARALFFDAQGIKRILNWPMIVVMTLMAIFATLDVALGLRHNLEAFIYYSGPGGPEAEFDNISYWVNVMKVRNAYTARGFGADDLWADCRYPSHVAHWGWNVSESAHRRSVYGAPY